MARGVTCSACGCLNFSSEHEQCDNCRSKTPTFRPTARRASVTRQREDAGHSNGKKRRFEATKSASKRHRAKPPVPSKKQPDVIDLVSDEEEDEEMQKVPQESFKANGDEHADGCFQSRVFPSVTFRESDFPSLEEGVVMRKVAHSQPATVKAAAQSVRRPTAGSSSKEKPVEHKPVEPRPPTEDKERQVSGEGTGKTTGKEVEMVVGKNAEQVVKNVVQSKKSEEDPFFQARRFDAVKFQASDFVTVFDALPAARRSHPPSVNSSASSKGAASTSVGPVAPTVSAAPEVTGPPTVASSTVKPASADTTKKPTPKANPVVTAPTNAAKSTGVTTAPAPKAKAVAASAPAPAQSSTLPPSTNPLGPASKKPTQASTTAAELPPAASNPNTVHVAPAFSKPTTQGTPTSSVSVPPEAKTKVSATATAGMPPVVPTKSSSAPAAAARFATMTAIPSTLSPLPVVAVSKPAPATMNSQSKAIPSPTTKGTVAVDHAASKVASVISTASMGSKAEASANTLLPKKRHLEGGQRADGAKQRTKPLPTMVKSPDVDAVLFVKVNAAPLEMAPVEPPVLGYCSPEFLAFMRECGDEDADEDDDPEEVSRSQLKLLDVVDLTSLSDSDDSDTESPLPTPRASVTSATTQQQGLPVSQVQMKDNTGPSVVTSTAPASGNRTWFVPTLDSERTRTRPEKVMCELCEETGLPSRLVRCPTCTKYYHRKCARENGDENFCWNCDLGSMIDDSELDEEHAKHDNEYLAYLRAIRRSSSPVNGDEEEEEQEEDEDGNEDEGDEDATGDGDVQMARPVEGGENNNPFSEESDAKSAGKSWKEFVGGATADVDDTFNEVTKRIAEELHDDEKKHIYSRGFVSRDEFETQMAEVEEYYISEEARLQQLEREKALEGRKAAEARRAQASAEQAALASVSNVEQLGDNENKAPSVSTSVSQPAVDHRAGVSPASSVAATTPNAAQHSNTPAVAATVAAASPAPRAPVATISTIGTRPAFYAVHGSGMTFGAAFQPRVAKPTPAPPPVTPH